MADNGDIIIKKIKKGGHGGITAAHGRSRTPISSPR